MDNGAAGYQLVLDGDDSGCVEIVRDYKDGLILCLSSFVENIFVAENLAEDTFVKIGLRSRGIRSIHGWPCTDECSGRRQAVRRQKRFVYCDPAEPVITAIPKLEVSSDTEFNDSLKKWSSRYRYMAFLRRK